MREKSALYQGYTLAEVLVVLMIVIILGGIGAYSFSGLRDSVLVKQNIEEIKQDLQLVQQKAMLVEKRDGEGWIYGIGIDFTDVSNGRYTFFKWCSPFTAYGDIRTRSEILAYDSEQIIGVPTAYGPNAKLPLDDWETSGLCNRNAGLPDSTIPSYLTIMPGIEEGKIHAGFNIALIGDASYVVFETVTGRVFLYDSNGMPVSYSPNGVYIPNKLFAVEILRNRGKVADVIKVYPLSGAVSHDIEER